MSLKLRFSLSILSFILILAYNNCGQKYDFNSGRDSAVRGDGGPSQPSPSPSPAPDPSAGPSPDLPPSSPPAPLPDPAPGPLPSPIPGPGPAPNPGPTTPPPVCDPFGGNGGAAGQGLLASGVYYVKNSLPAGMTPSQVINGHVENFFSGNTNIGFVNSNIFLSAIDFPNMYFSQGFTDNKGNTLKTSDGTTLVEYFGIRAQSDFVMGSWAPGDYQIGILSDDGSILTMTAGAADGTDFVINNDGDHSLVMGCTSKVLHMTANSKISMNFDYYQGPRITIGLMMLYRPVSLAGTSREPLCGSGSGADAYYFLDHDNNGNAVTPIPQPPYLQLTGSYQTSTGTGGWKVVEPEHFKLPGSVQNPCVAQ